VFRTKDGLREKVLNKKPFMLEISSQGTFSGLFGFSSNALFGGISGEIGVSVILSAFLIVLLAIIIIGVSFVQGTSEDWVEMRE